MCRTGDYEDEKEYYKFLDNIVNKRVVVLTAGWRGEAAMDTERGGYLIQALVSVINSHYDNFVLSLLSFKYAIKFIQLIILNYLIPTLIRNLRIKESRALKTWNDIISISKSNKRFNKIKIYICKKLTSVYFSSRAREYLNSLPEIKRQYIKLLKYLCREYDDINLENAAGHIYPSYFK